ncbi:hypothetical protein chiPu_0025341, partial [Chiloscyllium punctatum]|nr:hypothetical protein [Chiloscyllium punctatum]
MPGWGLSGSGHVRPRPAEPGIPGTPGEHWVPPHPRRLPRGGRAPAISPGRARADRGWGPAAQLPGRGQPSPLGSGRQ